MRRRALLALALLAVPALVLACPTCKDALGENPETKGFALGIYYSILLMFGVLFSVVGLIIYKIVQEARRQPVAPESGRTPTA
jgi:hypothetical protein